jgi:hypothetical protein
MHLKFTVTWMPIVELNTLHFLPLSVLFTSEKYQKITNKYIFNIFLASARFKHIVQMAIDTVALNEDIEHPSTVFGNRKVFFCLLLYPGAFSG